MKKTADNTAARVIRNRIIKTVKADWTKFGFLQPDGFKELTKENYEKLRESILKNNFVESFKVWEKKKGELYCLDGYHRCKVLKMLQNEGYGVPQTFSADFIECKNEKEAAKLVLIYSSIYAAVEDQGLYEFLSTYGIGFEEIIKQIDIPSIDLKKFSDEFLNELKDADEKPEVEFTKELLEEHNYIVLYWENEIDWLQALSLFNLKSVKALDAKPGFMKMGIGRVLKGSEAIEKLKANL